MVYKPTTIPGPEVNSYMYRMHLLITLVYIIWCYYNCLWFIYYFYCILYHSVQSMSSFISVLYKHFIVIVIDEVLGMFWSWKFINELCRLHLLTSVRVFYRAVIVFHLSVYVMPHSQLWCRYAMLWCKKLQLIVCVSLHITDYLLAPACLCYKCESINILLTFYQHCC